MNRQILKEQVLFEIVKSISKLGTCSRSKVGAIIVRDGRIISTGHNGSPPGEPHCLDVGCTMVAGHCVATTHAESNAIAFAARSGISTLGATIYVTGWITGGDLGICPACEKLAKSAGIVKTVIVR
jgi:dCMP deaminase